MLLEGLPGAGKTAIAAQFIKDSGFYFVQTCSPHNMADLSESAKCAYIRKVLLLMLFLKIHLLFFFFLLQVFYDATYYDSSCILIDNIEGIIVGYVAPGHPFSTTVLRTFMVFIKERTPAMDGRKLLVLCTTSRRYTVLNLTNNGS